jgi:DNA-binding CsgD family transcriptional regulator
MGDRRLHALTLHALGNVVCELGDLARARSYFEESGAILRELSEPGALTGSILSLSVVAQEEGAYDQAESLASEALCLSRQAGDWRTVAHALANLGVTALTRGDYAAARDRLGESIALQAEVGDAAGVAFVLERFAGLAAAQGRHAGAVLLVAAAAALRERAGTPLPSSGQAKLDRTLEPARRVLGQAAAAAWQAGRALALDEAVAEALAISDPAGQSAAACANSHGDGVAVSILTPREQEVAALIARGYTNRQIAQELIITEGTVATHVVHILNKLGFSSRAQVAAWSVEHGLVSATAR